MNSFKEEPPLPPFFDRLAIMLTKCHAAHAEINALSTHLESLLIPLGKCLRPRYRGRNLYELVPDNPGIQARDRAKAPAIQKCIRFNVKLPSLLAVIRAGQDIIL